MGCTAIHPIFSTVVLAGARAIKGAVIGEDSSAFFVLFAKPQCENGRHAHKAHNGTDGDDPFGGTAFTALLAGHLMFHFSFSFYRANDSMCAFFKTLHSFA